MSAQDLFGLREQTAQAEISRRVRIPRYFDQIRNEINRNNQNHYKYRHRSFLLRYSTGLPLTGSITPEGAGLHFQCEPLYRAVTVTRSAVLIRLVETALQYSPCTMTVPDRLISPIATPDRPGIASVPVTTLLRRARTAMEKRKLVIRRERNCHCEHSC